MIAIGSFAPQPNAAEFSEYIEVLDDETGTAWDLSTSLIEMEVRDQRGCRRLYGSTSDGKLGLLDEGFDFSFQASEMRQLCAGSYVVNVRITDSITGAVTEPIIANLPVIEGGYR
jgi:hypothetical protein